MLIFDFHVFWLQPIIENKNEKKVQQPLPKIVVFFFKLRHCFSEGSDGSARAAFLA